MEIRELLHQIGTPRQLSAHSKLHFPQHGESAAYYVLSGCLTLKERASDRVVDVSWPGDLFGTFRGVVRAAVDSNFVEVAERPLLGAMADSRELAAWVWQQQQQRMVILARRIRLLSRCTVEQRILQTLIELDDRAQSAQERLIPLAQKEVAELAGVTREATSTLLNRLQKAGLVSIGRRRVVVEAPDGLRTLLARQSEVAAEAQSPAGAAA